VLKDKPLDTITFLTEQLKLQIKQIEACKTTASMISQITGDFGREVAKVVSHQGLGRPLLAWPKAKARARCSKNPAGGTI
jgi:hypothetical protein